MFRLGSIWLVLHLGIYLLSGQKYNPHIENISMDMVENRMEIRTDIKGSNIGQLHRVDLIVIDNKGNILLPDSVSGDIGAMVHAGTGKMIIWELHKEYDVYVPNYGGGGGTKDFKLKNNNNLYIKLGRSTARKIYKKKDFLNVITGHHDQVKQYMKANRISVRNQKELEELVLYYNTL